MFRKSKTNHSLARLTEREVVYSYNSNRAREVPQQPGKKTTRLILDQAGINRPSTTNTVEITYTPAIPRPFSATVERQVYGAPSEKFHIAFGADKHSNVHAIVTDIGKPGEPLVPAADSEEKLAHTQAILNQHIESK